MSERIDWFEVNKQTAAKLRACREINEAHIKRIAELERELADTTNHNERLAEEYAALEKELDCLRTQMPGEVP